MRLGSVTSLPCFRVTVTCWTVAFVDTRMHGFFAFLSRQCRAYRHDTIWTHDARVSVFSAEEESSSCWCSVCQCSTCFCWWGNLAICRWCSSGQQWHDDLVRVVAASTRTPFLPARMTGPSQGRKTSPRRSMSGCYARSLWYCHTSRMSWCGISSAWLHCTVCTSICLSTRWPFRRSQHFRTGRMQPGICQSVRSWIAQSSLLIPSQFRGV